MTVDRSENNQIGEIVQKTQPHMFRFVVIFAMLMLLVPLLPGFVSNLAYAFSGENPKIYWYLSRSAGFVSLTILWVSMAMGLTITNKLAKRWPGTPAAFAVHQYVSLLGLAFAVYHALVLMGDHFVDFSFPRLITPFSIEYERFWVGLGQLGFYIWGIVVLSFYVRKVIGQKVWRWIHYANFVMYAMGLSHGIFSGTETRTDWAQWYYWLSALSLLVLVAYRVYQARSRKEIAQSNSAQRKAQPPQQASMPVASSSTENLPAAPAQEPAVISSASAEEITPPIPSVLPEEARISENMAQPILQEEKRAPAAEKAPAAKDQQAMDPPRSKEPSDSPTERVASTLRIQKLFDEIEPPKPLPEKPAEQPVLRIQIDLPLERAKVESLWDKVTLDELQVKSEAKPIQPPPSQLLLRIKENLTQNAEGSSSRLRIRPRRAVVEEDRGNV